MKLKQEKKLKETKKPKLNLIINNKPLKVRNVSCRKCEVLEWSKFV